MDWSWHEAQDEGILGVLHGRRWENDPESINGTWAYAMVEMGINSTSRDGA